MEELLWRFLEENQYIESGMVRRGSNDETPHNVKYMQEGILNL